MYLLYYQKRSLKIRMKRRAIYLLLTPLVLSACVKTPSSTTTNQPSIEPSSSLDSSTTSLPSSSSSVSSSIKPIDTYTKKTINAYYLKPGYDTTVDIRYYNNSVIPYISFQDYHRLIYRSRTYPQGRDKFVITQNNDKYTIEVAGGEKAVFDVTNNTFECDNVWLFKNTNLAGTGDISYASNDGLPFIRVKSVTIEGEPAKFSLNFSKYNLKIYGDTNAVYVPIGFAMDLFSNENVLAGTYNQKDLFFFNYTENEFYNEFGAKYYDPMFSEPIPQEYIDYTYNETCLRYDVFQGKAGRNSLEKNYDLTNGLDAALESRPLGKLIKQYLHSTVLEEFLAGATLLSFLKRDGGHSYYEPLGEKLSDGSRPKWLTDSVMNKTKELINIETAKGYKEIQEMDTGSYGHGDVYTARNRKLSKLVGPLKGYETYTKDGDIAYIHIDGFMDEIYNQNMWAEYYKHPSASSIPFGSNYGGAVGATRYGVMNAHNDPEVKHIVVDLGANTGGSTDEMFYMLCMLTGQRKLYTYNQLLKVRQTTEYDIDIDLNGVFDERDYELVNTLLEGKDVSVLTTRNGFSCGGISPIYLHEEGVFTIGENCGGGSCAIYIQFDGYGTQDRTSCPDEIYTKRGYSVDMDRFFMCDHKMNFPETVNKGIDYSSLYDTATLRTLIEEHYAK